MTTQWVQNATGIGLVLQDTGLPIHQSNVALVNQHLDDSFMGELASKYNASVKTRDGGMYTIDRFAQEEKAKLCAEAMYALGWDSIEWSPMELSIEWDIVLFINNATTVEEVVGYFRQYRENLLKTPEAQRHVEHRKEMAALIAEANWVPE
jgi:hypothetical protein